MKWFWRTILILGILAITGLALVFVVNLHVQSQTNARKYEFITSIPADEKPRIAIVLGAKVWGDGTLSNALYDRVVTAVELYRAKRVSKLLMSGDNPSPDYDEPTAMKKLAVSLGVPEADIVLDFAGRRTYDTCYRAKEIFEIKQAIIVTQEFHEARSLYLCNNLGVDSIAVKANRRTYDGENYWAFREFFSVFSAWFEMNFIPFEPVSGKKEPIEP